jgi:ABC-type antimicrobial peptide transport system permease subunit
LKVVGTLNAIPVGSQGGLPTVVLPLQALIERVDQVEGQLTGGVLTVLAEGSTNPVPAVRNAGFHVDNVSAASTIEAELASRQEELAIGMDFAASVASLILALLALALGIYFGASRRDYEFGSLQAVGQTRTDVIVSLTTEYGLLIVTCLAVGYGLGSGLLRLVVDWVAPSPRAAIEAGAVTDWAALMLGAGAVIVVLCLALAGAGLRLRRASAISLLRGEPE